LKIAHVISSLTTGGAEVFVSSLAIEQAKTQEVEVWAMNDIGNTDFSINLRLRFRENNVKLRFIGSRAGKDRLKRLAYMRKLIKQSKPDIIITHSEANTFYTVISSMGLGVNMLQVIHSSNIKFIPIQKYFVTPLIREYVAISESCKNVMVEKLHTNKITVIDNGIDIARFKGRRIINFKIKNIIILGRLAPEKDHGNMLKAFRLLCDRLGSEKKLVPILNVVGDGILRAELERLTENLGLSGNVIFHGVLTDIPKVLLENDLLVMSSKWEGMSIALIEAAASRIPIIATNVGSNKEIIRDGFNGRIVEKENPDALAEVMYELMDYNKRLMFFKNSNVDKYDIKFVSQKYIELCKKYCS
jgi:glycosyltransferase involved in cell wall biosynthesis